MKTWCVSALLAFSLAAAASAAAPAPFFQGTGSTAAFRSFEDDAGGFYIVWAEEGPGKTYLLRAQHADAAGKLLWAAEGLPVTSALALPEDWSGLADGQGGLTLFWDETDGVHAQRFRPDGSRRRPGNSVLMSTSTAIQPDAVPDATGGTLFVWREKISGGRSVLMAQRMDSEGKPVWPKSGIRVSLRASNQTNPRIIYDNVSGLIVAYRDEVSHASEMRVQRIDFQANRLWTLEGLKVMAPLGLSEYPQIAPLGTGEAVLAWTASASQTNQVFVQKAGPAAVLQWKDMHLASNIPTTYNRWNPLLIGDEEGGTWIAWEDYRNQLNYQLQMNHLHGDGKSPWPRGEIAVSPVSGDQGKAAMTLNGKDGVWIAWVDNRLATVGIYLQGVDQSGNLLFGKKGYLLADGLSKPSVPKLVSISPGKVLAVWADRPKKDRWSLFWSVVEAPAPPQ